MTELIRGHMSEGVATLVRPVGREHSISLVARGELCMLKSAADVLGSLDAQVLQQFVFGGTQHYPRFRDTLEAEGQPTTWIQGDPSLNGDMLSTQIMAVSGVATAPVMLEGKRVGTWYEDGGSRWCHLGGILPADVRASRAEQTRSVFERMAAALESCGMAFADTVRTWLYLDRLLEWYPEFNRVRTTFFKEQGVFERRVPASTGIGGGNPYGAALMTALMAVRPASGIPAVRVVSSPLQCSAEDYKSSFSRAMEVEYPTHRTLYISGTASIDAAGHSISEGDPVGQIERTLDVVEALLESRGMTWGDTVRGIVYYKDIERYQPLFQKCCRNRSMPYLPLAVAHADICRDNLLFELELDAVQVNGG